MGNRNGKKGIARLLAGATLSVGLALSAPAPMAVAQSLEPPAPPATLIADDIRFDQGSAQITARGGVEVFFEGSRLRATAITYNRTGDRITVEGPLTLIDPTGNAVIVAGFADLSADLQEGVLQSARLVLDRQLQIAASRIDRVDGRYTQAYQAVASTCEVCFSNPVPLWEIRAERVIHDEVERQIYFEDAQFRVMGVPVIWLPQMRMPDPTLERATGFLAPSIRATDTTGTQVRVPYFVTLGDSADVTVTPWIGLGDSQTIELRYRQAFRTGEVNARGSVTWDDLTDEAIRGHIFADGRFDIGRGIELTFRIEGVTDDGYLTTYGFTDPDLLQSDIRLARTDADTHFDVGVTNFLSLRAEDNNRNLPTRVFDGRLAHRFTPDMLGGIAEFRLDALGYARQNDDPGNAPDGTPLATDAFRLSGVLDWQRSEVLRGGAVVTFETAFAADLHSAAQDANDSLNDTEHRFTPYGAITLRYPMARTGAGGVRHVLEPVIQAAWSETYGDPIVEEDTAIVEFDEGNLLSLDRFPGSDRRETGARTVLGLTYTRIDPAGWSASVAGGLILRADDFGQFTPGSGLDGRTSDFLLAANVTYGERLSVMNRAVFDQSLEFTSNETQVAWRSPDLDISTSYTWLEADPAEGRSDATGEWAFDADYRFGGPWTGGVDWRFDFAEGEATRAGLNLGYANECVDVGVSVTRRFTTSDALDPATEFGLTVALNGFGASREGRSRARTCMQ